MRKVLIFGNSASGKSTLSKALSDAVGLAHLDLDTLAWAPVNPPERLPLAESEKAIMQFIDANPSWVIEGCYSDLLNLVESKATNIIFMDLPVEQCIANARSRPWEPHKYESKEKQDENLEMLINWIAQYREREDTFSFTAHEAIYNNFTGEKNRLVSNEDNLA